MGGGGVRGGGGGSGWGWGLWGGCWVGWADGRRVVVTVGGLGWGVWGG